MVAIDAFRFSKLVTLSVSPVVWSVPAATEKSTAVMPPMAASTSVSDAAAAVDRSFRAVIDDGVVAAAGADDVGAATAVDRIATIAAGDDVDAGGSGDRYAGRKAGGIDVLEIDDDASGRRRSGRHWPD